jgi:tRNA A37 threonylcarbamoyladenosine modification protein TsaB
MANDNRRQKYGNIVLAADARFKQVLKATQVEKECRLHEKIYRAYLKQVQQDQVQQDQDQAEQDQAQQDQDQAAKHLFEEKVKAELKIFRVVIKHMDD